MLNNQFGFVPDTTPQAQTAPAQNDAQFGFIPDPTPAAPAQPTSPFWSVVNGINDVGNFVNRNVINPIVAGSMNFGGNIGQDVGKLTNTPSLTAAGQSMNNFANKLMPNPNLWQSFLSTASQAAPLIATTPEFSALKAIPYVGRLSIPLSGAVGGAEYGASQNQTNRVGNAIGNGILGAGIATGASMIPGAVAIAGNLKNILNVNGASSDLVNAATQGLDKNSLNAQNVNNIIGNYNAAKANATNAYTNFGNYISQLGYANEGAPLNSLVAIKGTGANMGKFFAPTNELSDGLSQFVGPNSGISNELKTNINNYLQSPTYQNSHVLQSALGSEAASINSSAASTAADKMTASTLNNLRGQVKDNITNTFVKNGQPELADAYNQLSNNYKNTVVPYQNNSQIWQAIRGKQYPVNVINSLQKTDQTASHAQIQNDLLKDPQQSQGVLAQALAQKFKQGNGQYMADAPSLLNAYDNLPDEIQQFGQPSGLSNAIESIRNNAAQKQSLIKAGKVAGIAATAGIGPSLMHYLF